MHVEVILWFSFPSLLMAQTGSAVGTLQHNHRFQGIQRHRWSVSMLAKHPKHAHHNIHNNRVGSICKIRHSRHLWIYGKGRAFNLSTSTTTTAELAHQ